MLGDGFINWFNRTHCTLLDEESIRLMGNEKCASKLILGFNERERVVIE